MYWRQKGFASNTKAQSAKQPFHARPKRGDLWIRRQKRGRQNDSNPLTCGLQQPTYGEYTLYGLSSQEAEITQSRRRMGAVVETPSIYMDLTAADNLKEQYRVLGLPSYDSIPELLKLVGLENTGKKKARNFSLGMRQRLGIAVALAGLRTFSSWMSQSTAWTPRALSKYGS